jgi:signal transduction histidine kinase/tetratricopeptide (TPR) repeat protein
MKRSIPVYPVLSAFLVIALSCCTRSLKEKNTKHSSEEILSSFKKRSDQQQSRDIGIHLADSFYKTFPYISAPDKYGYYDFKRSLFELIRYGKRSYDTAIIYTDSMIAVIEENKLQREMSGEYAKAFSTRGEYFMRIKHYNEAIKDISRSRQLNGEAGDSCLMAENTKTLSSIAVNQSDYSLAADLVKEALRLSSSCKKDREQFVRTQRYLDDLGFIYSSFGKIDSALIFHFAAAKYVNENKQLIKEDTLFPYRALENIYGNIGVAYLRQKKYPEAEHYLVTAIAINLNILHDSIRAGQTSYSLGTVYYESGQIDKAKAMAENATTHMSRFEPGFKAGLLKLKADIAKAGEQFKEEADYRQQLQVVKDSISKGRIDLLKNNPFTEYEQMDKKYQIELLKKDNQNQQNKIDAAIVIGILLTMLAAISIFLIRRLRSVMSKRAVVYNQLVESEKELKETMLQKEIAEKQLREKELFSQEIRLQMEFNEAIIHQREKISDDMHDELSSSLAALKFYAEDLKNNMKGTPAEKPLSEIADEIKSVYGSARNYMHSLKSNNYETQLNLTGFLKEFQRKFTEKGLLRVKLEIDEQGIERDLTRLQHNQLYHIIKESVSNVMKHANASEIKISILFDEGMCRFSVSDNGKGFPKGNIIYGIGMKSISKRIEELGGEISFTGNENGTVTAGHFIV